MSLILSLIQIFLSLIVPHFHDFCPSFLICQLGSSGYRYIWNSYYTVEEHNLGHVDRLGTLNSFINYNLILEQFPLPFNLHKQKITWEIMNVTCPIVQRVSELSFDIFSNCQGFVVIPQNVLRLLVSCVIKIKVKERE